MMESYPLTRQNWTKAKKRGPSTDFLHDMRRSETDAASRFLASAEPKKPKPTHRPPIRREDRRAGPVDQRAGLVIYTDGACEPNPGKGGWAFVAYRDGVEIHAECGGELSATNNTMELTGVIKALEWLSGFDREHCRLLSDSQYAVKGCNEWRHGWKRMGWKRGRDPLKNLDLWQRLDVLLTGAPVKIEWVKGHVGILGNERADELSEAGRRNVIEATRRSRLIEQQLRPPV